MLETYLTLPASQRNLFHLTYVLIAKTGAIAGIKVWLADSNHRTAIPIGEDGRLLTIPTLAQLHANAAIVFDFPNGTSAGLRMKPELSAPSATTFSINLCERALAQATTASRSAGFFAALLSSPLRRVIFVGAGSGEIVHANGTRTKLAERDGDPTYIASSEKDAVTIQLRTTPRAVYLQEE